LKGVIGDYRKDTPPPPSPPPEKPDRGR
jgi:hypothetical protein